MLETAHSPTSATTPKATQCGGCKLSVESESGGIVVAFGQSLWHVDCFKCAKCGNQVNADTNLLLLSDGSPVCGSCSYHCSVCKLPIVDEAIMTGDDSYHALCFTCKQCTRRIDELVFAKTTQGIYCMECHNERAARSRRHHEKKKRAKAKLEEEQRRELATQQQEQATGPSVQSNPSRSYTTPTLSAGGSIDVPPQRSSSMDDAAAAASLNVPTNRANKRRSLNPGLRLAEQDSSLAVSNTLPHSPNPSGLYSPAFSVDSSTMPSPGLVTTGSMAAQAPSHTLQSSSNNDAPNSSWNGVDRGRPLVLDAHQPAGDAHSISPTETPSSVERSRSYTPVPSNVDATGRASDDSETEGGPAPPPKLALNGVDQPHHSPIKLSFHDDPAFTNLLTSFGGDADAAPLTLRDPAGSRRSMQALANVALRLSEDSAVPNTPSTGSTVVQEPPVAVEITTPEEKTTLPPLPKTSMDGTRVSSEDSSHGPRTSSDSRQPSSLSSPIAWGSKPTGGSRPRLDSTASNASRPSLGRADTGDLVSRRLKEALADATDRGATAVKLDREFVEAILHALQGSQNRYADLKGRLDGMKRVSQRMFDGLSVAQGEYDNEVASRRDAEAEVSRLRLQLSAQSAELTALNAEQRRRELMEKMSKDMSLSLQGLEQDLSKLKAERDLTLAEVEELQSTREGSEAEPTKLSRSLTNRFDNLKSKYKRDLEPMIAERQTLQREIHELKQAKDVCLEETTALTARNDELYELNVSMTRRLEDLQGAIKPRSMDRKVSKPSPLPPLSSTASIPTSSATTSTLASVSSNGTYSDDREDARYGKGAKSDSETAGNTMKKFAWFKGMQINPAAWALSDMNGRGQASSNSAPAPPEKPKVLLRHNFQQQSVLRFARCDHCGDKMWGTQLRCSNCSTACHTRCIAHLNTPCREATGQEERDVVEIAPLPPSMFGRDLTEQVEADAQGSPRAVPVIVEKCIMAVEARAMEYEGIYRKTGGAGQSKAITHAFERGDYDAFDLQDAEVFNDICSVTSVLKNYFRALPNPLLTFELHEAFVQAASYRDMTAKSSALTNVLEQMPHEHYETLRMLMLHLHGVMERSSINLMTARNLGVVFGPTLMRSADSAKEFADMAGKALCIEWLVEQAPIWTQLHHA